MIIELIIIDNRLTYTSKLIQDNEERVPDDYPADLFPKRAALALQDGLQFFSFFRRGQNTGARHQAANQSRVSERWGQVRGTKDPRNPLNAPIRINGH